MTAVDEFDLATAPAAARGAVGRRRRWHGRPAPWVAAAAALVLVGIALAPPSEPTTDPGIVWNVLDLDLRDEPMPLWQAPIGASDAVGVIDGTLVVEAAGAGEGAEVSTRTLVGVELATGAEVFMQEDPDNTCQLGHATLTCVADRGGPAASMIVRDSLGRVIREQPHPDALSAVALDDGGYVLIEGTSSGVADLLRVDADGAQMWRTATTFSGRVDPSYNSLHLTDGWVETASGAFDLDTGEPPEDLVRFAEVDPAGSTSVATHDGTVLRTTAGDQVVLPADEPLLDIDDSPGGPLALTGNHGTVSVHRRDEGASLWTITEDQCWVTARLQSTLVMQCFEANGSRILALDQLTGSSLWTQPATPWSSLDAATTDTLLLSTPAGVSGVDPRTGEDRWRIWVPGTFWTVEAAAGAVVVLSDEALIRIS